MFVLLVVVLVVTTGYYLLKVHYRYWEIRGIVGPKPTIIVGNIGRTFLLKISPGELFTQIYNQYPDRTIVGVYTASTPSLLIRDPDVIKDITVKFFANFHDNDIYVDKKADPLFGRHPFVLKGEEWKIVRAQLTPAFTSGKMKWVYPHLEEMSQELVKFINQQETATNGEGYEAKELCMRYTLNNVATCAFGLQGKCFEEENNEFREIAKEFLSPGGWSAALMFLATIFPILHKIVSLRFTSKQVERKLTRIVSETLKYRKENNIVRNDFLHILSQLKETCKDYEFTDVDVTAHAGAFIGDGYETSSIVMSFVLYQLASNSEEQERLREEIHQNFEENDQKLPYEVLQALPYLDGVIHETMRMNPAAYYMGKICTKSYTFTPKESSKSVTIENGTPIIIPVHGIQNDPRYFENPEVFKPERFVGSNKENIKKCTFLPFGEGPRSCLGQRFGILQIKTGVAYIIRNFRLSVNEKTQLPLKFDPTYLLLSPIGGLWIDFKKIT